MILLPQTPWTVAIAELLAQRMAAFGSGARLADVLANLLPSGEAPPDGWLEGFLAGTPIPGYTPPSSNSDPASPSMPGGGPFFPTAADDSPLASVMNTVASGSQAVAPAESSSDPPTDSRPQVGWEAAMRILKSGGAKPDLAAAINALCPTAVPRIPGNTPGPPDRTDPRLGSSPPILPNTTPRKSTTTPGPYQGTVGSATGGAREIEITVEFDSRKLIAETKLVAESVTHRIVDRQNLIYASQTRGSMGRRR